MSATPQNRTLEAGDAVDEPCTDCDRNMVSVDRVDENPGVDVGHTECGGCGAAGFIYLS